MTPREAWDLYSCYGCDEAAVNTLLTKMWIEAGRPPRKEADLEEWEALYGDGVAETRDELRREVAKLSAKYFDVCAELDSAQRVLNRIISNASDHGLLGQILEGLTGMDHIK